MTQSLLTPTIITRNTLAMLVNNLVMAKRVNRRFENNFTKIGTQLTVRKPNRFVAKSGPALQVQTINEPSVVVTINQQAQVAFEFSSADMTLTIEEARERYFKPAAETLANFVDYSLASLATQVPTSVGTPTSTPSTFATSVALTGQQLDEQGAPQDGRSLVVNPAASWSMAGAQSNAFVTKVSENALIKGYLSTIGNQGIYMDQNIQTQAASTYGGSPLTNGTTLDGATTLVTNGWTSTTTTLAVGATFTVATVYAVNPQSRQSTGKLQSFTVTTATTTDGSGNSTISFSPPMYASGPFQNVTNVPATSKAIVVTSGATTAATTVNNVAFCKDAFGLVMVPMEIPGGVDMAARENFKGFSMRTIRDYDVQNDVFITRIDMLFGVVCYYPELATRLYG